MPSVIVLLLIWTKLVLSLIPPPLYTIPVLNTLRTSAQYDSELIE